MPLSPNGIQVVQDVLGKDEGECTFASSHRARSPARKAELVPRDTLGPEKQTVCRDEMVGGRGRGVGCLCDAQYGSGLPKWSSA